MTPRWYDLAQKDLWTKEVKGPASNPVISGYFTQATGKKYGDEVSWCAAFVGAMLEKAGVRSSRSLLARSYLRWGEKLALPREGCIVVLKRGEPWQGHVGFFVRQNRDGTIMLLGGNQSDQVNYRNFSKRLVIGYRWPKGD